MTAPDLHQPSFVLWPLQNSRTAYAPVALPVILVVPHRRTADGEPVLNSEIQDLVFRIEDVQRRVPVAGEDNQGVFVPNLARYEEIVTDLALAARKIPVSEQRFEDRQTGASKEFSDVVDGDLMVYTTEGGNLTDRVDHYQHADYYDLSTIFIETYDLYPFGKYVFSWNAQYYARITTSRDELFCIDDNTLRLARTAVVFDHPGDVHQDFIEKIPDLYFQGERPDQDSFVKFLRPFADVLQDVFDEVEFLKRLNSIDHIPAPYVPYLAHLLGWSLPFFPGSTDVMRRRVLKNARRLQTLKGSKRALRELFEVFGYAIDVINVWFSADGKRLLAPGDPSTPEEKIEREVLVRADPLLSDYNESGFGGIHIPLVHRPLDNITVEAWIVKTSSSLYDDLLAAVDSWASLENDTVAEDIDGFLVSTALQGALNAGPAMGYSQVLVNQEVGGINDRLVGTRRPLNRNTVTYDGFRNELVVGFDHYLDLASDERLFVFATYEREHIVLPDQLADLRSNRFDISILNSITGDQANPQVLEYLLEFVINLKAFHSLIRKIIFTISHTSVYNVTDFCAGRDQIEAPGTVAGEAQVPPAIIPTDADAACTLEGSNRGFKAEDLKYRSDVLTGLVEEFDAWKRLDETCALNPEGQDRRYADTSIDVDQDGEIREQACKIDPPKGDYCYTGRPKDFVEVTSTVPLTDTWRCQPCELGMGEGLYFTRAPESGDFGGEFRYDNVNNIRRSLLEARYVRAMVFGQDLQYTQESALSDRVFHGRPQFHINMPQLHIQKDNLFIPGHRHPTMNKLPSDYTSSWFVTPWDNQAHAPCPGDSPQATLVWSIEEQTDESEDFVYDQSVPLIYLGNGIEADITNLGQHLNTGTEPLVVTHSIYAMGGGHEAITFDGSVVETGTGSDEIDASVACIGDIGAIFDSASPGIDLPPDISYASPVEWEEFTAIPALAPSNSGGPATTYSIVSGSLPPGVTLNPNTGEISGTPTDT